MSYNKPGRFKNVYKPKMSLLIFVQRQEGPENMVQSIVDDLINLSIEISDRNAAPELIIYEKTLASWSSKY